MPPVASEAAPAAAGTPSAGDQVQALFKDLNFAELQSQLFAGPETLGALGAQGNAALRNFLGRLKTAEADVKIRESNGSHPETEQPGLPLHGGPAREPFERGGSPRGTDEEIRGVSNKVAEFVIEQARLQAEVSVVGSLVIGTTRSINELIKGQ
jgi:hypothetical protein